jgi:hypothetical protein
VRYRFKGIVRTTGQPVEGHAHGETPDVALSALSEHGIVTESLREEPEALNMSGQSQPLSSAIDSALDTAASQVPFEAIANRYKGKSVWVLDRDKIRKRVAQVVDAALRNAVGEGSSLNPDDVQDLRKTVADAIGGLFKDNRNLTSEVSNTSMKLEHQIRRIEQMVHRAESVLAQMTIAISRGGGWGGGGGAGPRRYAAGTGQKNEQNSVLLEIFKENLKLRGIEIDENPPAPDESQAGAAPPAEGAVTEASAAAETPAEDDRPQRPESPLSTAPAATMSQPQGLGEGDLDLQPESKLKP